MKRGPLQKRQHKGKANPSAAQHGPAGYTAPHQNMDPSTSQDISLHLIRITAYRLFAMGLHDVNRSNRTGNGRRGHSPFGLTVSCFRRIGFRMPFAAVPPPTWYVYQSCLIHIDSHSFFQNSPGCIGNSHLRIINPVNQKADRRIKIE